MTTTRNAMLLTAAAAAIGILAGTFMGYSQEGFTGTKNCGMCHPQELKAYNGHVHATQKGKVPDEAGIGCESCHGSGAAHVALGPKELQSLGKKKAAKEKGVDFKIVSSTSTTVCAPCHSKSDNHNIQLAADDLIVNMQTVDELYRSKKTTLKMTCTFCHDPHTTSKDQAGISRKCLACHTGKYKIEVNIKQMQKLTCEDCHMPYAVTTGQGTMVQGYHKGEKKSHVFGITADPNYKLNDGTNHASLNSDGYARLTVEMTCYACHKTGVSKDMPREQLLEAAAKIHK